MVASRNGTTKFVPVDQPPPLSLSTNLPQRCLACKLVEVILGNVSEEMFLLMKKVSMLVLESAKTTNTLDLSALDVFLVKSIHQPWSIANAPMILKATKSLMIAIVKQRRKVTLIVLDHSLPENSCSVEIVPVQFTWFLNLSL
jgi:hypothetical protein